MQNLIFRIQVLNTLNFRIFSSFSNHMTSRKSYFVRIFAILDSQNMYQKVNFLRKFRPETANTIPQKVHRRFRHKFFFAQNDSFSVFISFHFIVSVFSFHFIVSEFFIASVF